MPKRILFESAVHQFLRAGSRLRAELQRTSAEDAQRLAHWLNGLRLEDGGTELRVAWSVPASGAHVVDFRGARFYTRGDTPAHAQLQAERGFAAEGDAVMTANARFFDAQVRAAVDAAGLLRHGATVADGRSNGPVTDAGRKHAEQAFHDDWAAQEDIDAIDVRRRNEACTAPEMRHIRRALGDLRGRELLDVGCGLGEASVYFALEGARVVATDVSPGMCAAAQRLAVRHGTTIETHVSAAEDLGLGDRMFDVIYTGNTLHHVDIPATMDRLLKHLRPGGMFVSWDPVAYNPLINVYRRLATEVRTPDEHPLRLADIRAVRRRFASSEVRWFWFTTLLVFVWMAVGQRRSPNRERYWKKVVDEADTWQSLYRPLERVDRILLTCLPFLRPLCWNVVIVGRTRVPGAPPPHA